MMEIRDLVTLIAQDKGHRAIDLVVISLRGLQTIAGRVNSATELIDTAREMQNARPASASLQNVLDAFCERLQDMKEANLAAGVAVICNDLAEEMITAQDAVAERMATLVEDGETVMTYSMSSSIRRFYEVTHRQNKRVGAIVCESRPGMEGRLMANDLSHLDIETTYITESQVGIFMKQADKVVLGADRLLASGDVVNKAGSLPLALVARHYGVPVYVCADSFKQSSNDVFETEEFDADELELPMMASVKVRNIYLEVLPKDLISQLITDKQ
ncbi:MAG: translation initiation factor eIF-2B [Pseudomonadales bacterium]|nr:translation initiation factor eIF-2B [Pseudomonadales bacterium]